MYIWVSVSVYVLEVFFFVLFYGLISSVQCWFSILCCKKILLTDYHTRWLKFCLATRMNESWIKWMNAWISDYFCLFYMKWFHFAWNSCSISPKNSCCHRIIVIWMPSNLIHMRLRVCKIWIKFNKADIALDFFESF